MEKLKIVGRTNWSKGFYIKFKATTNSMEIIKKMVEEADSEYFYQDYEEIKNPFKYNRWKDRWIQICEKKLKVDIICGDKVIHLISNNCKNYKFINGLLNKYCVWIEPKKVKSNKYKTKRIKRKK